MTSPTEMEMRVAEALLAVESAPGAHPWEHPKMEGYRQVMLKKARAAIQAMREPYPEMAEAAIRTFIRENGGIEHAPYMTWRAMIDAASPTQTRMEDHER